MSVAEPIAKLEAQIQAHIDQHPALKRDRELLTSINGIGDKTAAIILSTALKTGLQSPITRV